MTEFDLVERFHTDDGELVGITSEEAFCLGVEWEMFRSELNRNPDAFVRVVLANNVDRITKMVAGHRRSVQSNEALPGWHNIEVGAYVPHLTLIKGGQ